MNKIGKLGILSFIALLVILIACNKPFDRSLSSASYADSTKSVNRVPKVLYLIVDGARGWSVRDANAPNITALTNNAIYSWSAVSDSLGNDGNGWADLLTGVNKLKHKVIDNTFAGNNLSQYPTIFKRIKDVRPDIRIASFASSSVFNANFSANTDQSQLLTNDAAVTSSIVGELGNDAASLVVGEFNSVNTAGAQSGYDNSFPAYKTAILQFDQYLGQIMAALKARKTYAKENWLVVVTSNHGGAATVPNAQNDGTIFSYALTNTFTIIYNTAYVGKLIDKPFTGTKYIGSFLRFYSSTAAIANGVTNPEATSITAKVTNNNNAYTFGDTTSFTIELKIKRTNRGTAAAPNYNYTWPMFFSKKVSKVQQSSVGWGISLEGDPVKFLIGKPGLNHVGVGTVGIKDGLWHSFAFVVLNRNFHRYIRAYTDGVFNAETQIPDNFGIIDDPSAALTLGVKPQDLTNTFDGYMSDIRIWKTALPDGVISQYSCNTTISSTHPFWPYLIGYWKGTDGSGLVIKDLSPAQNDFNVSVGTGVTLQWTTFNDIVCPPSTTSLSQLVPKPVDLSRQILSWFAIAPSDSWLLDGRVWLDN